MKTEFKILKKYFTFSFTDDVDAALVRDVCLKYFYDKSPVITAIGPIDDCPDYSTIRSRMNNVKK